MKIIKICGTEFQAHVIQGRLENEGIPSVILHANANALVPCAGAIDSLRIQIGVADSDYEKALLLLHEGEVEKEVVCPECGSDQIRMVLVKNRWMNAMVLLFACYLSLISSTSPGNIRNHYVCRTCGAEFH